MKTDKNWNGFNILAVEDSKVQSELLRDILEQNGYSVYLARNGIEGLEKTRELNPDIVVTDVNMPVMDGFKLCRKIKSDTALRNIPVVLLTQLTAPEDIIEGIVAGADNYIPKPYSAEYLISKLEQIITSHDWRAKNGGTNAPHEDGDNLITVSRQRITNYFASAYENILDKNRRLNESEHRLKAVNDELEQVVIKRTADLMAEISERERMAEVVQESEKRYRRLVEASIDYIYSVTIKDGRTIGTVHGPGCEGVTGFTSEEYYADPDLWYRMVHEEDRDAVISQAEKVLAGAPSLPLEHRIIHKDGSLRWVKNTPVPHYEGQVLVSYEGLIVDITERKNVEEKFYQAQKMEAIGRLAGGVAHDFNNCLTAIIGFSDLSMSEVGQENPLYNNLETVRSAALKASRITRQLLAFSRKQVSEPKIVNLNDLVSDLNKMLKRFLGEDIKLHTILAPDLGHVKSDPSQIEQVLMNLAVNARDAMPDGGEFLIKTGNIELDDCYVRDHPGIVPGEYIMIVVEDTGMGMKEEVKEHIFEPFFTTKGKDKGTGLGLATVYGIVKQNGGDIWCYSEEGKGTTFKIYLPRVYGKTEAHILNSVIKELPNGYETILVVEDEAPVRRSTVTILQKHGYTVLEACHGIEALEIMGEIKKPIHLILTDVVMPNMSGREFIERLNVLRNGFKVLYMSGYTNDIMSHYKILDEGMNFISKPFSSTDLLEKVRDVLDGQ
ncbi:MAG: response regulator [Nitrospirae bacterium]|nr:response regulator [Nitrospirota bacterium]